MTFFVPITCAVLGGLGVNLLRLAEFANHPKQDRPNFKDPYYILQFFLTPALGALLTYVYLASNTQLTPLLALNIGASAPLTFKTLVDATPSTLRKADVV